VDISLELLDPNWIGLQKRNKKMNLNWTGERLLPEIDTLFGTFEHLHRYAIALEICKGKDVLDLACGEGYGSNLLSRVSKSTVGVDVSSEVIAHAHSKYIKENLSFCLGSATKIPLGDKSIDVVVSYETLEHFVEHEHFMIEVKRVLRPEGILILSTPDRDLYHNRDPNNIYHLRELDTEELKNLVSNSFANNMLFKQRMFIGSVINDDDGINGFYRFFDGGFSDINNRLNCHDFFNTPFFNIIVASNAPFELPSISLFSAYNAYEAEKKEIISRLAYYKSINDRLKRHWSYKLYSFLVHRILNPVKSNIRIFK